MKKNLLFAMAATTMLFATSCQNDFEFENLGENSVVSFNVTTPDMATRAYSDGTTATHLQYAVYDANGVILPNLTKTDATINGSTTVELQLATGNTYSVVFWAAAPDAPYTVDLGAKTMSVNYNGALSNDEARDAFYKYHTFTVNGTQTETIELRRPFAQLNIGTADYTASTSAGYTPTQSAVTVKNAYSTLNLANGEVGGETEVTYATADIKKDETFPVTGYEYLAMNYVLVGAEKGVVDVEFTYTDGSNAKTRTVGSVPVQRNYRTNIYGALLTSMVDINVTIEPDYNEGDLPSTIEEQLVIAAQLGGTITLTEDVVLTQPLIVSGVATRANVENIVLELDLNGHSLSYTSDVMASSSMITINNGQKLVVKDTKGNGKISYNYTGAGDANFGWGTYTIANNGTLVVENGTIEMLCDLNSQSAVHMYSAIHQGWGASSTTINGGKVSTPTYRSIRINQGSLTINNGVMEGQVWMQPSNNTTAITINGGSFAPRGVDGSSVYVTNNQYDVTLKVVDGTFATKIGCSNDTKEGVKGSVSGGTFGATISENLIAEGYSFVAKGDSFVVVKGEGITNIATDVESLTAAMTTENAVVYLEPGKYLTEGKLSIAKGVTIIGNGASIKNDWGSNAFNKQCNLENVTFDGVNFTNNTIFDMAYAKGTVTFKNCTFSHNRGNQSIHFDGQAGAKVILENCTVYGRNMFASSLDKVVFNNCKILESTWNTEQGNKGVGTGWSGINMWGKYEFNNCQFDTICHTMCKTNGVEADFNNCSYTDGSSIENSLVIYANGVDTNSCVININ